MTNSAALPGAAAMESPAPVIEVRDLHYTYPDGSAALRGVNFSLRAGESVILLGANGSGKTTFVLHLNGLLRGQGHLSICGLTVEPHTLAEVRRRVGLVFQDADEQLVMPSVREDVAFGLLNRGVPIDDAMARADRMIDRVGLSHCREKAPFHLSSGEKRRAAIAGVLVMDPDVLVLDEPSTYLDPPGQRALVSLLTSLPQAKIVVTHDLALARRICSRAVFFDQGRVADDGPLDEILLRHDWTV